MILLVYLLYSAWVCRILINISSYVHLWSVKEYRLDRMLIHLKTKQGSRLLFLPWRRLPLRPKSLGVFLFSLSVLGVFFIIFPVSTFFKLFIVDILSFPVTLIIVLLLKLPTFMYHSVLISKSVTLLRQHKKMKVIGVTGSYGKTSTKEILYTLLSQKYKTLKTEASKNSPIAIAELLIRKLTPDCEVLIVEMGAYKRGEIAQMSAMVKPQVGIVTAINAQHLDLFGDLNTTMKAKYELIQGLSEGKIAIFNGDNSYTSEMGSWAARDGCSVWYYSMDSAKKTAKQFACIATNIKATPSGVSFTVHYGAKSASVSVGLLGKYQVANILAAISGAISCGMTFDEATKACVHIRPFPKTMQKVTGLNGSVFIDDTFNNNPDAARAAIDFLATTKGQKFFIFQPMIELGDTADESHRSVGAYAAKICDHIILTNDNFHASFISGVQSEGSDKKADVLPPSDAAAYIRAHVKRGDTVLFKGKESGRILDLLKAKQMA